MARLRPASTDLAQPTHGHATEPWLAELAQLTCALRLELAVLRGRLASPERFPESLRALEDLAERVARHLDHQADRRTNSTP